MRIARVEKRWVSSVRKGLLNEALELFQSSAGGKRLYLSSRTLNKLVARFGGYCIFTLASSLPVDTADSNVDLSAEFILFWKKPDHVGLGLFAKIFWELLTCRSVPARALCWFAHWCVFQGEYKIAALLLSKISGRIGASNIRLRAEFLALYGNLLFIRGKFISADRIHAKANSLFSLAPDATFQMFNLGLWMRISVQKASYDHLVLILRNFDGLNPETPDARYGLRLLTFAGYLNFLNDDMELAREFLHAAEAAYITSGSELDRCLFQLTNSLMELEQGKSVPAKEFLARARLHQKRFGTYYFIEELLGAVETRIRHESTISYRALGLSSRRKISPCRSSIATKSRKEIFEDALPLIDLLRAGNLEKLRTELSRYCLAATCTIKKKSVDTGTTLTASDIGTLIRFVISAGDGHLVFELDVPFAEWRNESAINNICLLASYLQSAGSKIVSDQLSEKAKSFTADYLKAIQAIHDIRTPLSAISLVNEGGLSVEKGDSLMKNAVARILQISNSLNDAPQLKQSHFEPELFKNEETKTAPQTNWRTAIQNVIDEIEVSFQSKEIDIGFLFEADPVIFATRLELCDLQRICSNLLRNSAEAIDTAGKITLRIWSDAGLCMLEVSDSGNGIPQDLIPKLGTVGATFNKKNGSGLGLSFAKRIAETKNGNLTIRSVLGEGTSVLFAIPN